MVRISTNNGLCGVKSVKGSVTNPIGQGSLELITRPITTQPRVSHPNSAIPLVSPIPELLHQPSPQLYLSVYERGYIYVLYAKDPCSLLSDYHRTLLGSLYCHG